MKKCIFTMAIATAFLAMVGCNKDTTPTYTVTVNVAVDETYPADLEKPVFTVKMTSAAGTVEEKTENGVAVFSGVLAGIYNFVASATAVSGAYTYNLVASAESQSVLADATVSMTATAVKASNLIFKEIYQVGCKIGEGDYDTYFRDQFYEIYNNSTETVYADSLCFADCNKLWNYSYTAKYVFNGDNDEIFSDSSYVFAANIWQIPGNGTTYPIQPGESIIVCQLAQNHMDSDSLSNKMSPVNLLGAEFEAITGETSLWSGIILHDGPAINMSVTGEYVPYQWLTAVGQAAMVMFKPSKPLVKAYPNGSTSIYSLCYAIDVNDVIDAVNIVNDETRLTNNTLTLPASLDAGCIWHSAPGTYTSESISRKADGETSLGTKKYKDTNNTTEDFQLNTKPVIRRDGVGVPSWNTWNN